MYHLIQPLKNHGCSINSSVITQRKYVKNFTIVGVLFFCSFLFSTAAFSATNTSEDISSILAKGMKTFEAGDYKKANVQFTSAVKLDANNAEALRLLGMSQYKLQDNKKAIQSLEKSTEIQSDNPETHYALGITYLARTGDVNILKVRGMLKRAVRHLEQAIKIDPYHIRAHFYLIQLLINAPGIMGGDEDRGLALNKKLAEIAPLQHIVVNSTIAMREEDFTTAEQLLLDADQQYPNKMMIAYSLGELYLRLENYSKALDYCNKFLAGPKSWDETNTTSGHYLLARIYKGLGKKTESQKYYSLVLENTKSKRLTKQVKRDLDELDGKFVPPDENQELKEMTEEQLNDPKITNTLFKEGTKENYKGNYKEKNLS